MGSIQEHDISATISHEARVVYASFLLDEGLPRDAWPIVKPKRLVASPSPGELRRWYVAARPPSKPATPTLHVA